MMHTEPSHPHLCSSPSFSSYSSSETLAQIAARVIQELRIHDDTLFDSWEHQNDSHNRDDDDFEFAFVSTDPNSSPVSADDIFYNGQIRPTYPLFDPNLLNGVVSVSPVQTSNLETTAVSPRRRRLPLRKLMFEEEEERETGSFSSSTSEADSNELDGVAAGTYCVWNPSSKKKSNSMGSSSSKRWKLRDLLLLRSHSDGKKEPLLFLGPTNHTSAGKDGRQTKTKYRRQQSVGIFSNGNAIGRNLQPF